MKIKIWGIDLYQSIEDLKHLVCTKTGKLLNITPCAPQPVSIQVTIIKIIGYLKAKINKWNEAFSDCFPWGQGATFILGKTGQSKNIY